MITYTRDKYPTCSVHCSMLILFNPGNTKRVVNLTPLVFPIFAETRWIFFLKTKIFLEASICDVSVVESLLGFDPTQGYGQNTKSPIQDFIYFAIKTY